MCIGLELLQKLDSKMSTNTGPHLITGDWITMMFRPGQLEEVEVIGHGKA